MNLLSQVFLGVFYKLSLGVPLHCCLERFLSEPAHRTVVSLPVHSLPSPKRKEIGKVKMKTMSTFNFRHLHPIFYSIMQVVS